MTPRSADWVEQVPPSILVVIVRALEAYELHALDEAKVREAGQAARVRDMISQG
jgi:seryl-tRNA(Sec) selenium transferase